MFQPATADDFFDGAYWAAGWTFDRFFGDVLGPALFDQAVTLQQWDGQAWQDVA